jgi:HK97 family phage prohead protease
MIVHLSARDVTVRAAGPDDAPTRTIEGLAVPWGVDAEVASGQLVRFLAGSLPEDGPAPKFLRDHDATKPLGVVVERVAMDEGMYFAARVSATSAGDEALTLAADGVLDAVSVGVEPIEFTYDGDVLVISEGRWRELSLVPFGAFAEARVASVAAAESGTPTNPPQEGHPMSDTHEMVEAAAPAATPTAPIIIAADRARLTPAQWLSAAATGRNDVLAAAAEMGTSDTPGLLPEQLVGSVYDTLQARRPLVAALGTMGMPSQGEVFHRRRVTQHTAVDVQSAQFAELASQAMQVERVAVEKIALGGYVDLSEQEVDWSDPAAVALVLNDLGKVYAKRTEQLAAGTLVAGATEELPISSFVDGDEVLDALYTASATIHDAVDQQPSHLFVSTDRWADLGKMKQDNGDRLFPPVGPSNAGGTMTPTAYSNVLGLTVVVSNSLPTGTFIVGVPSGVELYEQNKGSIRVDQPATMSVRLAWRGYFASLVIDPTAFVAFVAD